MLPGLSVCPSLHHSYPESQECVSLALFGSHSHLKPIVGFRMFGCSDGAVITQSKELGVELTAQALRMEGWSSEENQGTVSRRGRYARQAQTTNIDGPALSLAFSDISLAPTFPHSFSWDQTQNLMSKVSEGL